MNLSTTSAAWAIINELLAQGIADAHQRVIVGYPKAEGLYGDEAARIFTQQFQGSVGGGGLGSYGGGSGEFGGGLPGGSNLGSSFGSGFGGGFRGYRLKALLRWRNPAVRQDFAIPLRGSHK